MSEKDRQKKDGERKETKNRTAREGESSAERKQELSRKRSDGGEKNSQSRVKH